jgi:AcrR family transcriptional regulator
VETTLHLYAYSDGVISRADARRKRPAPLEPARRLRADAQLNRDRILDAAAELFAERGISAPLDEVARRAGVGVATLYRRFPTRADLAAATFERNISRFTEAVDRALAATDPWQGFRGLVFDLCELQAGDAGLREMLTTAFPPSSVVEQRTAEAVEKLRELMLRAQRDGSLRADVTVADVVVMLLANSGVLAATGQTAPDTWRRFAALMVDAFGASPTEPLPPAPAEQQLRRSIAMLAR